MIWRLIKLILGIRDDVVGTFLEDTSERARILIRADQDQREQNQDRYGNYEKTL